MGRAWGVWIAVALVVPACGGRGLMDLDGSGADATIADGGADLQSGDGAPDLVAFEGIYAIRDVTLNSSGCAAEGPSVLASQAATLFAAVVFGSGNAANLSLIGCTDVADCESKAAMERTGHVSGVAWLYSVHGPAPDLNGDTFLLGALTQGQCAGDIIEHADLTGDPRGMVRIQVQNVDVPAHAATGATCDVTSARQAAAGVPCARLTVVTGNYQQPF